MNSSVEKEGGIEGGEKRDSITKKLNLYLFNFVKFFVNKVKRMRAGILLF